MRAASRTLLALIVLPGLTALSALAYASPPDPTWLLGVYDDADHDDVVAAVMATDSIGTARPLPLGEPRLLVLGVVPASVAPALPTLPREARPIRAPPGA